MLTILKIVIHSAVIAICVVAALEGKALIVGAPSIVRSVPASAFGGARSFLREEEDSFDEELLGQSL